MKKIVTMITALALVLGLAACGKNNPNPDSTSGTTPGESTTVSTEQTTDTNPPATDAADSPKALLEAIWNQYKEDDKFPAAGGDYDEANMVAMSDLTMQTMLNAWSASPLPRSARLTLRHPSST